MSVRTSEAAIALSLHEEAADFGLVTFGLNFFLLDLFDLLKFLYNFWLLVRKIYFVYLLCHIVGPEVTVRLVLRHNYFVFAFQGFITHFDCQVKI